VFKCYEQRLNKLKILYFSTVNWKWIKQRPQFIAEGLSENRFEVDFFSITPFGKQKVKKIEINDKLKINDRYVIPLASKAKVIKAINKMLVKFSLRKEYDIVVLTHPEHLMYLPCFLKNNTKIIYECMDNIPLFYSKTKRKYIEDLERKLSDDSQIIIVSSNYLKMKIQNKYGIKSEKIKIIRNAVDKKISNQEIVHINLRKPNLMYIGTISEWLDVDTLICFANKNLEFTIYLVGPFENSIKLKLKKISNIIFVGKINHDEVASYIASGDIMIIPFIVNELIEGVDPVKLYEYLAFNKPVVTSYWNELESFRKNNLVKFYSTYEEFEECIKFAELNLKPDDISDVEFIQENCWDERIIQYVEAMKGI